MSDIFYIFSGNLPVVIALSVGPNIGIIQTCGGMLLPNIVGKYLKSNDLIVGKYWKLMGQKTPNN